MKGSKKEGLKEKLTYYWKNPGNGRYYNATLTQDLLGDWIVIKSWGGSKAGRVQYCYYKTYDECLKELRKLKKKRETRGYSLLDDY